MSQANMKPPYRENNQYPAVFFIHFLYCLLHMFGLIAPGLHLVKEPTPKIHFKYRLV